MRKNHVHRSKEEILLLLREYHESGMSKSVFCKLHGLSCVKNLNYWLQRYGSPDEVVSLHSESESDDMSNRSKSSYIEENAALKKRIKELEKALSFSRLETESRDLMIDRAEEYFNIPIRKKSGAK